MAWLLNLILRVTLLLAGLVAAASMAVAASVLLAVWGLRMGWARLTGRPAPSPFVRWQRTGRAPAAAPAGARPAPAWAPVPPGRRGAHADVTDVEPK